MGILFQIRVSTGLYELVQFVHMCVTRNVMVDKEGGEGRDQHAGGFI